jgi:diguanylate cyclase (GGDEF)-like protein/PAS domain S-box-containing protein
MNSLAIFDNPFFLYATLVSLAFFLLCGIYISIEQRKAASSDGIKYLVAGLVLDLFSAWFASLMNGSLSGVSPELLIAVALIIKLITLILFVTVGTNVLLGKGYASIFAGITGVVGLFVIVWSDFISPNGAVTNLLSGIFPAIGFAYLTAAFFVKCFNKHAAGYIICDIVLLTLTYYAATYISAETFVAQKEWYVGIIGYSGMGIGLLFVLINSQSQNLDALNKKINKYDTRFKEIIKLSPFPIMIARLSDDTILSANDNFLKVFGLKEKELEYHRFRDFFVDIDNRRLLNSHIEKEKIVKDFEILVKSKQSETPFWLSVSANIIDYDYDIAIYAAFQDITDRKKREDILKTQATKDPLTSLFNRRYFEEEVNRRIESHPNDNFCVCMIDADHFKNVNDTYGHKVGDKVLMALASTAEKALRDKDIVARYGGEEFVVYLANNDETVAKSVADRLREAISEIVVYSDENEPVKFTVSIGIASSTYSRNLGELVKMSDDALYEAKETGRNRCVVYHKDLPSEPQKAKEEKAAENVHPAFAKDNNVEVSLLHGADKPEDEV